MIFHVIIRRPYSDLSGFYDWAVSASTAVLVGEHEADKEIATTHCHFMINADITDEGIRKQINKRKLGGRGQYAILTQTEKAPRLPYDEEKLCIYILKGGKTSYHRSTFDERVPALQEKWVHKQEDASPVGSSKSEKTHWDLIQQIILESQKIPGVWGAVLERTEFGDVVNDQGILPEGRGVIFDVMVRILNENKVRTSRNELERFYVSIVRHDYHSRQLLRQSIMQNVFRV